MLANLIFVDIRSHYDFQALPFTSAINIPIAGKYCIDEIVNLCSATNKDIDFFCNEHNQAEILIR